MGKGKKSGVLSLPAGRRGRSLSPVIGRRRASLDLNTAQEASTTSNLEEIDVSVSSSAVPIVTGVTSSTLTRITSEKLVPGQVPLGRLPTAGSGGIVNLGSGHYSVVSTAAPQLKDLSLKNVNNFLLEYPDYFDKIQSVRGIPDSAWRCIDLALFRGLVAMEKLSSRPSDEEVFQFLLSFVHDQPLVNIRKRLEPLNYRVDIPETMARLAQLSADVIALLSDSEWNNIVTNHKYMKIVLESVTRKIKPEELSLTLRLWLDGQTTTPSWKVYLQKLSDLAEPLDKLGILKRLVSNDKIQDSNHEKKRWDKPKFEPVSAAQRQSQAARVKVAATASTSVYSAAPSAAFTASSYSTGPKCFKCNGPHSINKCPQIGSEAERQKYWSEHFTKTSAVHLNDSAHGDSREFVNLIFGTIGWDCLVDGGSTRCLLGSNHVKILEAMQVISKSLLCDRAISFADGVVASTKIVREVYVFVTINGKTVEVNFCELSTPLPHPILGVDLLHRYGIKVGDNLMDSVKFSDCDTVEVSATALIPEKPSEGDNFV
jgi:hypothetical protein